jgi:hypothetical protein
VRFGTLGNTQVYEEDYSKTFAPSEAPHSLLSSYFFQKLKIYKRMQLNINMAFLNAEIRIETYVIRPDKIFSTENKLDKARARKKFP